MTTEEPLIFEIDEGPSPISQIFKMISTVDYLNFPMITIIFLDVFWVFLVYKFRFSLTITTIQFLISVYIIYQSPRINEFLNQHWKFIRFSNNYFDPSGIFTFTYIIIPQIVSSLIIIICLFLDLCKSIAVHRFFKSIISKSNNESNINLPEASVSSKSDTTNSQKKNE